MEKNNDILDLIRKTAEKKRLFTPHALRQMSRPDRMISTSEVRLVIENGKIIEEYPDDLRGHSFLMFGKGNQHRPIHVVCAPKNYFLAIITAYIPNEAEWSSDFQRRRTK